MSKCKLTCGFVTYCQIPPHKGCTSVHSHWPQECLFPHSFIKCGPFGCGHLCTSFLPEMARVFLWFMLTLLSRVQEGLKGLWDSRGPWTSLQVTLSLCQCGPPSAHLPQVTCPSPSVQGAWDTAPTCAPLCRFLWQAMFKAFLTRRAPGLMAMSTRLASFFTRCPVLSWVGRWVRPQVPRSQTHVNNSQW